MRDRDRPARPSENASDWFPGFSKYEVAVMEFTKAMISRGCKDHEMAVVEAQRYANYYFIRLERSDE